MKSLSAGKLALLVVLGVIIIGLLWSMGVYNTLVSLEENINTAQADVEVQYQRRFDLIPNITASVQGIFNQEKEVFKSLAEARSKYAGSNAGSSEKLAAIQQVEGALSRLLVVVENYPELRSSESVQKLMDELAGTENRVSVARNRHNAVVNEYNKTVRRFPGNILAGIFGFEKKANFEASEEAQNTVPQVNLN